MRKRIISPARQEIPLPDAAWLQLEQLATIELTSEDADYPIEAALAPGATSGWRAAEAGEQTIRIIFDQPQRLRRIRLLFVETESARTQEFLLRSSVDGGNTFREIVRQQWNFSSPGATQELEDYRVELDGVTTLELIITPDKSGGAARASLRQLRLA
jgi:hypothetical protein